MSNFSIAARGALKSAATAFILGLTITSTRAQNQAPADGDNATVDEIIVSGRPTPGAVIGDIPPENQLHRPDIDAYGVGTISELIGELAAQLESGQARENDGPVILVNGKRISGVNEVGDLPTEAILRVDVLPKRSRSNMAMMPSARS